MMHMLCLALPCILVDLAFRHPHEKTTGCREYLPSRPVLSSCVRFLGALATSLSCIGVSLPHFP